MIKDRVQKLSSKSESEISSIIYVMQEMGWSWKDAMETPYPAYIVILEELVKKSREEANRAKRKK